MQALINPQEALTTVNLISDDPEKVNALYLIAKAQTSTNLEELLRAANSFQDHYLKALALVMIAQTQTETNPGLSNEIFRQAAAPAELATSLFSTFKLAQKALTNKIDVFSLLDD